MWAFASRAHPAQGEIYFNNEGQNILPVFLDPNEKFSFRVTKVIHNCLVADRHPPAERPKRSDLEHGWPTEIREGVLKDLEIVSLQGGRSKVGVLGSGIVGRVLGASCVTQGHEPMLSTRGLHAMIRLAVWNADAPHIMQPDALAA